MDQSERAAENLLSRTDIAVDERIPWVYRQVLGRLPSDRETALVRDYVGDTDDAARWTLVYQTLFQSVDFRFVY
jgi:hypothetical protein